MILNLLTKKLIWFFFLNFIQLISHVPDSHVVWIMLLFWCQWFSLSLLFLHECSIHRTWFCRKHALLRFRLLSVKQGFFSVFLSIFFRSKKLSAYHLITFRIRTLIANVRSIMRFVMKNLIFFGARWLEWSLKISSIILWKTAINHNNDADLIKKKYGMEFLMKIAIECILYIQFHWNYSNRESKFFF